MKIYIIHRTDYDEDRSTTTFVAAFLDIVAASHFTEAYSDLQLVTIDSDEPLPKGYAPGLKRWHMPYASGSARIASHEHDHADSDNRIWAATQAEATDKLLPLEEKRNRIHRQNEIYRLEDQLARLKATK